MVSSLIYGDRCDEDCSIWQRVDRSITVVSLALFNKKNPKVCSCSQIPASCRGLNHKWHLYLWALTPLMKGKHLRPCWPCSLSAHAVIIPTVSLSLYLYLFSPLLPLPPLFFSFADTFHSHSLGSSSIITFRWRGSGDEPKWRSQAATRARRCDSTCWQKQGFTHINE